jgi:hypothetical protein
LESRKSTRYTPSLISQETHPLLSKKTEKKFRVYQILTIALCITSILLFYGTTIIFLARVDASWIYYRKIYAKLSYGISTIVVILVVFVPLGIRLRIWWDVRRRLKNGEDKNGGLTPDAERAQPEANDVELVEVIE